MVKKGDPNFSQRTDDIGIPLRVIWKETMGTSVTWYDGMLVFLYGPRNDNALHIVFPTASLTTSEGSVAGHIIEEKNDNKVNEVSGHIQGMEVSDALTVQFDIPLESYPQLMEQPKVTIPMTEIMKDLA